MREVYENPLCTRYSSAEMSYVFSSKNKIINFRKLWFYLAKVQKEVGFDISDEALEELEANVENIDFEKIVSYEKIFKHEVMANIHAYSDVCVNAKPIIHLGETSMFVLDNADLIMFREGINILEAKLLKIFSLFKNIVNEYKDLTTLAFTHYQPESPTTVGKRASLWCNSFVMDYEKLQNLKRLKLRGIKGTTGNATSFYTLLEGTDSEKYSTLKLMNEKLSTYLNFAGTYPVGGQTYDRKVDTQILQLLSDIASSALKLSNDIRLLSNLKEIEEPYEKTQVGSSAMPYKRNPMLCERISSLSKFVNSLASSGDSVSTTQWLERSLDDSAIRRLNLPQAFLTVDGILNLVIHVLDGLVVYPKMIKKNLFKELPFMITENVLMEFVKNGGDRQEGHEIIRKLSNEAGYIIKHLGEDNPLIELLKNSKELNISEAKLEEFMNSDRLSGFAREMCDDFIDSILNPILNTNKNVNFEKKNIEF